MPSGDGFRLPFVVWVAVQGSLTDRIWVPDEWRRWTEPLIGVPAAISLSWYGRNCRPIAQTPKLDRETVTNIFRQCNKRLCFDGKLRLKWLTMFVGRSLTGKS